MPRRRKVRRKRNKKRKFNDGGLARGPSHSQGGIPGVVGKGTPGEYPIEFEGGEYIMRKESVSKYGEDKKVKRKPKRPVVKLPETRTIDEERERGENLLDPSILRRPEQEEEE